jgi:hypothetical protein
MPLSYRLEQAAAEYLTNTDSAYLECDQGISALDKIIVGTPSHLSDQARAFLIPMIYAYWERFFRIAFSEFLRCVTLAKIDLETINLPLASFRISRELSAFAASHKIGNLNELAHKHTPIQLRPVLKGLHDFLLYPVEFPNPTDWIKTYSNVGFETLEENCRKVGVPISSLTQEFANRKSLFQSLNDLVEHRNKVAHGQTLVPVPSPEWEAHKTFVYKLMQSVQYELHDTLANQAKLLVSSPTGPNWDI